MNFFDAISIIGWVAAVLQLCQFGIIAARMFRLYSRKPSCSLSESTSAVDLEAQCTEISFDEAVSSHTIDETTTELASRVTALQTQMSQSLDTDGTRSSEVPCHQYMMSEEVKNEPLTVTIPVQTSYMKCN
jgi:hypothetical protein